jgi:hypothetical protein
MRNSLNNFRTALDVLDQTITMSRWIGVGVKNAPMRS